MDPFGPYALAGLREGLPPFTPGGYGTLLTDGGTIPTSDQASKTACYYAQDAHNAFPIIKSGTRHAVYFDLPRLVLSSAHAAGGIYDAFGVERNGKGHLVTGPVWSTLTAGSGARGTGGGTTELARAGGVYVNRWGIPGLNGDGSQFIPPGEGCYLFSIYVDAGAAGQVTCHTAYGQSRKWGVWNAHNRKPIALQMGDATATWAYSTNTVRQSRADTTNTLAIFSGLPEESCEINFDQTVVFSGVSAAGFTIGAGVNSTTAYSGQSGRWANNTINQTVSAHAKHLIAPFLGLNNVNALESGNGTATTTFQGGNDDMLMIARWRG